jgi:hypothetical protein
MRQDVDPKKLRPGDALDCLLDEARAGASDAWLAEHADVSLTQVRRWREQRGLVADKGTLQRGLAALQGLSPVYDPEVHTVDSSVVFEAPEYVVREALDYSAFSHACYALHRESMMGAGQVASALGVRRVDVELALVIWKRHLSAQGTKCLGCDQRVDQRYGNFCSRTCHDRHLPAHHL